MTLPIPLTVRLANSNVDRHITRDLRDLSFRSVAPGGFASATLSLDRPLDKTAPELAYFTRVYIGDARNGNTIWEGRLEDPGKGVGADGLVWDIAAIGPQVHLEDDVRPLVYVDAAADDKWRTSSYTNKNGHVESTQFDEDTPSKTASWFEGTTINSATPSIASMIYRHVYYCGQKLARAKADALDGTSTSNRSKRFITRATPGGSGTVVDSSNWNGSSTLLSGSLNHATNAIPSGDTVAEFRIQAIAGGSIVVGDGAWCEFRNLQVQAMLIDKAGADITTAGYYTRSPAYVLASEVIADLLGRILTNYDGANATVDTTSYQITHLIYVDGTTSRAVLDDMLELEPLYTWAVWESNAAGKYRFEWKSLPTSVRYEARAVDGFSTPSSAKSLYNKALIRYTTTGGQVLTTTATQTVPALDSAGITRTLPIDLGDNAASAANAAQAGAAQLADYAAPMGEGTLTIARPIFDRDTGKMIQPWEIRPGFLIRVSDVPGVVTPLSSGRDGSSIFRIVSADYSVANAAATLELDSYSYSTARALAKLDQRRARRR